MAYFRKIDAKNKQGYKWICVKDGPPDPVTGERRQISRRADTKKEAEARVDEALRKLTDHGIDEKKIKNLPFEKVAREWLDTYSRGGRKENTLRLRKLDIKRLCGYFGKMNIDIITLKQYQNMLNDLDDKEYSRSTIESAHVTAGMIFKYAVQHKMRKDNPCTSATIPVKRQTVEELENDTIEGKYLEREELFEFLNATKEFGLVYDLERFYLLAFSGMRVGELLSLKWSDVNFETDEIRIIKTLYNPNNNKNEYQLTPPKTKGSIRTIEIDDDVMKLLKKHKIKQTEKIWANKKKYKEDYHDKDFVFCRDSGHPFAQVDIYRRFKRLLRFTTIEKDISPHALRHTHVSMLAEAKVDLITIMRRVGHDDSKTTQRIYTHVTNKMKKDASEKVKNYFSDILKLTKSQ